MEDDYKHMEKCFCCEREFQTARTTMQADLSNAMTSWFAIFVTRRIWMAGGQPMKRKYYST